ncbi:transposase [Leptolyngbya cf. ectocarpi LEGE 11479]|uniref:Transposase n=2 Tax=Leptolyngbya ectocarpi TaxID=1202 RepID=A0A928ZYD2_LEPEC|nr:transposase [Leptolyngbya cf. ectocarpi LEGE 11479]
MALYFLDGLNSGFVEGFNNRVKVLKRRCYGIFDVDHIFKRLSLDINDYEWFPAPSTLYLVTTTGIMVEPFFSTIALLA